ncbi:MAG: hypothetical protein ACPLYX_09880 [Rectinema subterraneum]|uniref:hypothetical protein n=1 Tax=Rectinema subterraneum TaxID=2653714 RepID=UPI003C7B9C08
MKRRSIFNFITASFLLLAVSVLVSCSSQPKNVPATYAVDIQKLDQQAIFALQPNRDANPFVEPGSLLRGKINEFVVFRIDIFNNLSRTIRIDSIMQDRDQNYIDAYFADKLVEYWDQNSTRTSTDKATLTSYAKKVSLIKKLVVPYATIPIEPGKSTYYLVFVGPYPIKRPAKAQIDVSTDDGEYNSFEFALQ